MAVTVTSSPANVGRGYDVWGRRRVHFRQVTFDNSYPTGGEVLGLVGIQDIKNAQFFFQQRAPLTGGYHFVYDRTNDKLLVFWADGTAVAAGALPEVANTTDLSA